MGTELSSCLQVVGGECILPRCVYLLKPSLQVSGAVVNLRFQYLRLSKHEVKKQTNKLISRVRSSIKSGGPSPPR